MRDVVRTCRVRRCGIEVKWQQKTDRGIRRVRWIRLLQRRTLVGESPHATIGPKIMIERAVFLDEDNHVLYVRELRARRARRRRRGRAGGTPATTVHRELREFGHTGGSA